MEYEAIRIPKYAYDSMPIVKAKAITNQATLARDFFSPKECPLCREPLENFQTTVSLGYCKCSSCGYGQPTIRLKSAEADIGPELADLGKGILMALGVAALAYLVSQALQSQGGGS